MNKRKQFTRRQAIALGGLTLAGLWTGCSNQLPARLLRGRLSEIGHPLERPAHQPHPGLWDPNGITATWIGHATVLLNCFGVTVLTDPTLFPRVGAEIRGRTMGPKRLVHPALRLEELPPIDLVLLSHAHMDHFDLPTLRALSPQTKVVTARATADLLQETSLREVTELGWGDQSTVRTAVGDLHVSAFEVKHWGARWQHDTHRGYNGYVLEREGKRVLFGGDTALCHSFRSLRCRGPYVLAIMPIGSYRPWNHAHCTPEESVAMANAANAEKVLPIHFGTFPLGREGRVEPVDRLREALEPERIALTEIGQTFRCA